MNFVILGAVLVQWFISSKSRLWGAVAGLAITVGIGIWGLDAYAQGGQITFFGIALSQGIFLLFIAAWTVYDVVMIAQAAGGKATVRLAEETRLYQEPGLQSPVVAVKQRGDSLTLSANNKNVGGMVWSVVLLGGDQKAYIPGSTPILRQWKTLQKETHLYSQPDKNSPVLETLPKGSILELGKSEKLGNEVWVRAASAQHLEGFIPGNTAGQEVKQ
ncbi:MAG: hypothetical protein HPY85_15740 [Anaerolineae bacterium]|nr:hypothetical protein [Anaerolineae bacterium]